MGILMSDVSRQIGGSADACWEGDATANADFSHAIAPNYSAWFDVAFACGSQWILQ